MDNAIQKVRQPAPSIVSSNTNGDEKKFKVVQNKNIGVIQVPKTTNTPLLDWIEFKKKENPKTVYKLTAKANGIKGLQITASIGVIFCGIASLVKLFKK